MISGQEATGSAMLKARPTLVDTWLNRFKNRGSRHYSHRRNRARSIHDCNTATCEDLALVRAGSS